MAHALQHNTNHQKIATTAFYTLTIILSIWQAHWRGFGGNGMQRMKGGSDAQPLIRSNVRRLRAQRSMVYQTA
jgi:hypothetical protein